MFNSTSTQRRPAGAAYLSPPQKMQCFFNQQRRLADHQMSLAISQDMSEIESALALSCLLSKLELKQLLAGQLSQTLYNVICQEPLTIDHIGIEVFSSVQELKPIIQEYILREKAKIHIFKSVQVLEVIQTYDPELKQVDIMMVETKDGYKVELFSCHQSYMYTLLRKSNRQFLHPDEGIMPLNHIAFKVQSKAALEHIYHKAKQDAHSVIWGKGIYYNPADGSYNVKVLLNNASPVLSGQILELIYIDLH